MPFLRTIEVSIDVGASRQIINGLYTKFDVTYDTGDTPDDGVVEIYNLSPQSRQRIRERGKSIKVLAGYEDGETFPIVDGEIRRVDHKREPPDYITAIHVGGKMMARKAAVWTANYSGHHTLLSIIEHAIRENYDGVSAGDLSVIPSDLMEQNFVFNGPIDAGFHALLSPYGMTHYEERGLIHVSLKGKGQSSGVVISMENGMIGVPELTEEGLTVKTRLSPLLRLGDTAMVQSVEMPVGNRPWKVVKIQHVGDNRDGEFATVYEMEDVPDTSAEVPMIPDELLGAQLSEYNPTS